MRYYVKEKGRREKGPLGWYEVRMRVRQGKIAPSASVREEGTDAWFPLAGLVAREESRARAEVDDAMHDARRRSNGLLVSGTVLLVAGLVATLGSLVVGFLGGVGFVFIGLIMSGLVQIGRGLRIRP